MFTPDQITPQQRLAAAHRRGVRQIERAYVPLYGLPPGWTGTRLTGDTRFEQGVTRGPDGPPVAELRESVDLVHVDGASTLTVQSSDTFLGIDDAALLELLGTDAAEFAPLTVELGGAQIAFASAVAGDRLVARWAGYDATVSIVAERWPMGFGLQLVRIVDLAPYHEGRLRALEERSGFDLHLA